MRWLATALIRRGLPRNPTESTTHREASLAQVMQREASFAQDKAQASLRTP
jgi:hypothetical protein